MTFTAILCVGSFGWFGCYMWVSSNCSINLYTLIIAWPGHAPQMALVIGQWDKIRMMHHHCPMEYNGCWVAVSNFHIFSGKPIHSSCSVSFQALFTLGMRRWFHCQTGRLGAALARPGCTLYIIWVCSNIWRHQIPCCSVETRPHATPPGIVIIFA